MNLESLKFWSQIIDGYMSNIKDKLIEKYVENINFYAFFSSTNVVNKKRIKSF